MPETFFDELKRYVRFAADDEALLRAFAPIAAPEFGRIVASFYERVREHPEADRVFSGPEQITRLQSTLVAWMGGLFSGPWDEAYFERRSNIGRVHVRIGLPQRFMFSAMNLIRTELHEIACAKPHPIADRPGLERALNKIIDLELAIMLESYAESSLGRVREVERVAREELEKRLALSEARYDEIVENGEALVVTFEPPGRIQLFNRRAEALSGVSRSEASEKSWFELFCTERDRATLAEAFGELLAGQRMAPFEGPVLTGTGGDRRVRWHFTTLPGAQEPLLCAIGMDVTEERDLALRTRRAERLAALGTMAAGLAHEIRNPLNAAHIQLTLAQRRLARHGTPPPEGVRDALDLAVSEMKRLAGLVEDFLQFARPQPLRLAFVDLRAMAEATVALVLPEAEASGVKLTLDAGPPVRLEFDDEKMKQVLLNLLRNAVEATGRGGVVRVRVVSDGESCALEVEDDGRGLPSDAPIFEPFFTTKETGTGLGLAIVHRIVQDHGGTIDFDSRPGRTVFSVTLPLAGGRKGRGAR